MVSRTFLAPARRSGSGADWSSRTRVIQICHSRRVLPLIVNTVVRPLVLAIFSDLSEGASSSDSFDYGSDSASQFASRLFRRYSFFILGATLPWGLQCENRSTPRASKVSMGSP